MSSNSAIPTSSKATAPSGQLSPAQTQPSSSAATSDSYGQRRSGSSFGAGAATRLASPRNTQQVRKQHKASKKFRQADDDAIAETVSFLGQPVFIAC